MKKLLLLMLLPVAVNAAGITYENGLGGTKYGSGSGSIDTDQELVDPYNSYGLPQGGRDNVYFDARGNGAAADSYSSTVTTVSYIDGAVYENHASTTRSALADTGFSIDTSLSIDSGNGSLFQEEQNTTMNQYVEMSFAATTTLYITASYDSLLASDDMGYTGFTYSLYNDATYCNAGNPCDVFRQSNWFSTTDPASGGRTDIITVGPGDYLFNFGSRVNYDGVRTADDIGFNASVSVSTVPVPAAVWLFASGLGRLGWHSRRRA